MKLEMFHLHPYRDLPSDFVNGVKRYKYRGSSGKVNLALDALPNFTCLPFCVGISNIV